MSYVNIKMQASKTVSIKEVAYNLKQKVGAEYLITEIWRSIADTDIVLLSFEKYYFRNGGFTSLTVMLTEQETIQTADIIGSGGGRGIVNWSFGSNSNFAGKAEEALKQYGFCNG